MEVQFVDRLLNCSDCHGEFVFTAGEQLFFHDKQFKNDPKRCKPCKSRRSGLSAAANGATTGPASAGLSRTETRTECSECGVQTTVPFKPTQGRPVLCRQCFQVKNKLAASAATAADLPAATAAALTLASTEANGDQLSTEGAIVAAASMAGASPASSVASAADLASIGAGTSAEADDPSDASVVPAELLHAAGIGESTSAAASLSASGPEPAEA
jgi:CxxC-x17-CxxC domain-containing protein